MQATIEDPEQENNLAELNPGNLNAAKFEWVDGKPEFFPCFDGKCYPTEEQKLYAEELMWQLNEQIAHNGKWRAVLRSPLKSQWDEISRTFRAYMPTIIELQFLDIDDDPQFVVALEKKLDKLLDWGFEAAVELCEAAHSEYSAMMIAMDIKPEQTVRAAKGEAVTNEAEQYAID